MFKTRLAILLLALSSLVSAQVPTEMLQQGSSQKSSVATTSRPLSPATSQAASSGNGGSPARPGAAEYFAPPAASQGSNPTKPAAFPSTMGSKGGLWIGTIHGDKIVTIQTVVHHFTNTIQVKLREVVGGVISNSDPAHFHRIGLIIDLINEGSQYEG